MKHLRKFESYGKKSLYENYNQEAKSNTSIDYERIDVSIRHLEGYRASNTPIKKYLQEIGFKIDSLELYYDQNFNFDITALLDEQRKLSANKGDRFFYPDERSQHPLCFKAFSSAKFLGNLLTQTLFIHLPLFEKGNNIPIGGSRSSQNTKEVFEESYGKLETMLAEPEIILSGFNRKFKQDYKFLKCIQIVEGSDDHTGSKDRSYTYGSTDFAKYSDLPHSFFK